jgi:hypothetical protein
MISCDKISLLLYVRDSLNSLKNNITFIELKLSLTPKRLNIKELYLISRKSVKLTYNLLKLNKAFKNICINLKTLIRSVYKLHIIIKDQYLGNNIGCNSQNGSSHCNVSCKHDGETNCGGLFHEQLNQELDNYINDVHYVDITNFGFLRILSCLIISILEEIYNANVHVSYTIKQLSDA